jgi:hypothetical protein
MKFYGLPPIGQRQRRPMDGAQFHSPRVGEAGGRLIRNMVPVGQCIAESPLRGDGKLASWRVMLDGEVSSHRGSASPVDDCYKALRFYAKQAFFRSL